MVAIRLKASEIKTEGGGISTSRYNDHKKRHITSGDPMAFSFPLFMSTSQHHVGTQFTTDTSHEVSVFTGDG